MVLSEWPANARFVSPSRDGTTGGRDKDGSVSANRSGVRFCTCVYVCIVSGCSCWILFFNLTFYEEPLCPAGLCILSQEIYLQSADLSVSAFVTDESRNKFLDDSDWSFLFIFDFFFLRKAVSVVALNRMKIGRNLWHGKQEREMGTPLRDATEPETGRDSCSVHLEYSCSSFSLDVVANSWKLFPFVYSPVGSDASRNGYLSGRPVFVFIILIIFLIFAISN